MTRDRCAPFRSPTRPSLLAWGFIALLLLLSQELVWASRVRLINIEEMTRRADRIFSGRCVDVRVAHDRILDRTVTHVTIDVDRAVKGPARGRLTIRMLGNQDAAASSEGEIEGLPRFKVGEELILFLHADSRHGLTTPVGFAQGRFLVVHDKHGRPVATNGLGNDLLFRDLSQQARGRLRGHEGRWKTQRGIPPDDVLEMVELLLR